MAYIEKPPILRGNIQEQLNATRDYLFRLASSLDNVIQANTSTSQEAMTAATQADGTVVYKQASEAKSSTVEVQKTAQELKSLIIKNASSLEQKITDGDNTSRSYADSGDDAVTMYCNSRFQSYSDTYVAKSEFGTFEESVDSKIETAAKGVVESYGYSSSIESMQDSIDLMQHYYTNIDGEIRRGIIEDPDTGEFVTGIAISQNLKFSGECGPSDGNNPGDGYTYYYLNSGQTFGLYTSTGWQFWIDGYKKGWFNAEDGMLHVANILVENILQVGDSWQVRSSADSTEFEIIYVGE